MTQVKEKPDQLQIRARVRGDLDLLRTQYLPTLSETIELPHRDYPYRAYTDRATLGQAMVQMMLDLNYSNFKNEVMAKQGLAREQMYHDVWHVMYDAERKLADKERKNASRPAYQSGFDEFWDHYQGRTGSRHSHDTREIPVVAEGSKPMPETLLGDVELEAAVFPKGTNGRRASRNVTRRPSKPTKRRGR